MTELITAGAERFEAFRHALADKCMSVAVAAADIAAFRGRVQSASLGSVHLVDAAHFSRLFKAAYGLSPTEYRLGTLR